MKAAGATLVAISVDPPERGLGLIKKHKLEFPLLSDPKRDVIRRYGVEDAENEIGWPAAFIVGRDGKILWRDLSQTYTKRPTSADLVAALKALPAAAPATTQAAKNP